MKWYYFLFALQTIGATLLAVWLLYRWDSLFATVRSEVRREVRKVLLLTITFYSAFMPANLGWNGMINFYRNPVFAIGAYLYVCLIAVITALLYRWMTKTKWYQSSAHQVMYAFALIVLVPFGLDTVGQLFLPQTTEAYIDNISYSLFIGCCAGLVHLFFRFYSRKKELRVAELNNLKVQAELDALQSKINPHFLYNALSGLAGLALEDGRKASRMATGLSHLFRYNLNKEQQPLATVEEEVEMAETYLAIEKIRFEEALQVGIQVAEESRQKQMPRFLLQPLIENCIKHGFRHMQEAGRIEVHISGSEEIMIEVRDNGRPFPANRQSGYGLESVRHKLELLFPQRHQIQLLNEPVKAVRIQIQQQSVKMNASLLAALF